MKKLLGILVLVLLISGNAYPDVATNILKLKSLNACKSCGLIGADLKGANLTDANLYEANLRGADFEGANLKYANLEGVDFYNVRLRDANLNYANLVGANLGGVGLNGPEPTTDGNWTWVIEPGTEIFKPPKLEGMIIDDGTYDKDNNLRTYVIGKN